MSGRQQELEKKRQKLAELKRQREDRKLNLESSKKEVAPSHRALASSSASAATAAATASAPSSLSTARHDVDALVASLVGDRDTTSIVSTAVRSATPQSALSDQDDRTSDVGSSSAAGSGVNQIPGNGPNLNLPHAPSTSVTLAPPTVVERPPPTLAVVDFLIWDLPPRERVTYSKEVQTIPLAIDITNPRSRTAAAAGPTSPTSDSGSSASDYADAEGGAEAEGSFGQFPRIDRNRKSLKSTSIGTEVVAPSPATTTVTPVLPTPLEPPPPAPPLELSEADRKVLEASEPFVEFVERAGRLVELAMARPDGGLRDYMALGGDGGDVDATKTAQLAAEFYSDRVRNRSVVGIDWSYKFPELVLTGYSKPRPLTSSSDQDGYACVWNMHVPTRPEFAFGCQSDITSTIFSPHHPNLIVGGTYSGQIVLWDTRAKSLPVLKTPLSGAGHTHPVYALAMVGTTNAHALVSASTDGTVCGWQFDMLAMPTETVELSVPAHPTQPKTDEVAITSMSFPDSETTSFLVGTEEGVVYHANRFDRAGAKAGINPYDVYGRGEREKERATGKMGHAGPITGLHFHPVNGPGGGTWGDLFLTSSVDWTVQLWRAKSISRPSTQFTTHSPIALFSDASDYVCDVRWSPLHPAVFATVDGSGRMDLYNLNAEIEVPVVSAEVGEGRALNKVEWSRDGKSVAVGGADGRLSVFEVGQVGLPESDEWTRFQRTLAQLERAALQS
ncbi:hypothetical protein HDU93_006856 [Gonapodya sp. JEL0774]|nr:hypothetical protein HDU93_006856 [Gonapodya sp. JEL0774]